MMIKRIFVIMLSTALFCTSAITLNVPVNAVNEADILAEQTDMPIISISTSGSISSKEKYVDGHVCVYDESGTAQMSDTAASVRLRGNSTLNADKKSYKLKFESKQNVLELGNGSGKTWNLIADAYDTSLLRNMTAYKLGDILDGMPYTPNSRSVEVYLNGSYQGVYLLTEAVNINKSRIAITDNSELIEDNGYLLEMTRYAGENYFDIDLERYEIKNDLSADSEIAEKQIKYISGYIEKCYNALKNGEKSEVEELLDVDSMVDIYIASEIVKNVDAGWDSFYMFKNSDSRLTFGPMWDFDLALGNFIDVKGFDSWKGLNVYDVANINANSNPWFCHAIRNKWFRKLVVERWNKKTDEFSSLDEFVKDEASAYAKGYEHNFTKWNILGKKVFSEPDEIAGLTTHTAHINYLSDWIENRVNWLNEYFNGADFDEGIFVNEDGNIISEDCNIAEYTTNFMMFASDFTLDHTPSFTVNFSANSWWNMYQCAMAGVMLEKGQKYMLSFDCSATKDTVVTYKVQQNYGSYRAYITGSTKAEAEQTHFETELTSDVLDTNCALIFESNGSSGSSVTVSNIMLKKVKSETIKGDINGDGEVSTDDIIILQKWLVNSINIAQAQNIDLNNDNIVNIFDLIILKRMLIF